MKKILRKYFIFLRSHLEQGCTEERVLKLIWQGCGRISEREENVGKHQGEASERLFHSSDLDKLANDSQEDLTNSCRSWRRLLSRRPWIQFDELYTDPSGNGKPSKNSETWFKDTGNEPSSSHIHAHKHTKTLLTVKPIEGFLSNPDALWDWEHDVQLTKPWPPQYKTPVNNLLQWNFTPRHWASSTLIPRRE